MSYLERVNEIIEKVKKREKIDYKEEKNDITAEELIKDWENGRKEKETEEEIFCEFKDETISKYYTYEKYIKKLIIFCGLLLCEKIENSPLKKVMDHGEEVIELINGEIENSKLKYLTIKTEILTKYPNDTAELTLKGVALLRELIIKISDLSVKGIDQRKCFSAMVKFENYQIDNKLLSELKIKWHNKHFEKYRSVDEEPNRKKEETKKFLKITQHYGFNEAMKEIYEEEKINMNETLVAKKIKYLEEKNKTPIFINKKRDREEKTHEKTMIERLWSNNHVNTRDESTIRKKTFFSTIKKLENIETSIEKIKEKIEEKNRTNEDIYRRLENEFDEADENTISTKSCTVKSLNKGRDIFKIAKQERIRQDKMIEVIKEVTKEEEIVEILAHYVLKNREKLVAYTEEQVMGNIGIITDQIYEEFIDFRIDTKLIIKGVGKYPEITSYGRSLLKHFSIEALKLNSIASIDHLTELANIIEEESLSYNIQKMLNREKELYDGVEDEEAFDFVIRESEYVKLNLMSDPFINEFKIARDVLKGNYLDANINDFRYITNRYWINRKLIEEITGLLGYLLKKNFIGGEEKTKMEIRLAERLYEWWINKYESEYNENIKHLEMYGEKTANESWVKLVEMDCDFFTFLFRRMTNKHLNRVFGTVWRVRRKIEDKVGGSEKVWLITKDLRTKKDLKKELMDFPEVNWSNIPNYIYLHDWLQKKIMKNPQKFIKVIERWGRFYNEDCLEYYLKQNEKKEEQKYLKLKGDGKGLYKYNWVKIEENIEMNYVMYRREKINEEGKVVEEKIEKCAKYSSECLESFKAVNKWYQEKKNKEKIEKFKIWDGKIPSYLERFVGKSEKKMELYKDGHLEIELPHMKNEREKNYKSVIEEIFNELDDNVPNLMDLIEEEESEMIKRYEGKVSEIRRIRSIRTKNKKDYIKKLVNCIMCEKGIKEPNKHYKICRRNKHRGKFRKVCRGCGDLFFNEEYRSKHEKECWKYYEYLNLEKIKCGVCKRTIHPDKVKNHRCCTVRMNVTYFSKYCDLCGKFIAETESCTLEKHKEKTCKARPTKNNGRKKNGEIRWDQKLVECRVCNKVLKDAYKDKHLKSKKHKFNYANKSGHMLSIIFRDINMTNFELRKNIKIKII